MADKRREAKLKGSGKTSTDGQAFSKIDAGLGVGQPLKFSLSLEEYQDGKMSWILSKSIS